MQSDFIALAKEVIEFQKRGEPNFVEGERVQITSHCYSGNSFREDFIPSGSIGVVICEWRETMEGIEANCFILSVDFGHTKAAINAALISHLISVDPIWSKPPQMPYSLGGSNHGQT